MEKHDKIAVIDLGTNTFHLLVVRLVDHSWQEEFRIRKFVQLGEEGIDRIGNAALQRAFVALQEFKSIIAEHGIHRVRANGTAALRTAQNGAKFIADVKSKLNLTIHLIDGNEEAKLIFRGVRQAVPAIKDKALVMDIGGGSVEFIIADKNDIIWAKSFPIGVAVLFRNFHKSDPISPEEIFAIEAFLNESLASLSSALEIHQCEILIGASGTFDVLKKLLPTYPTNSTSVGIRPSDFPDLYQKFISTNLAQRLEWPSVPPQRAGLIIVALVLINFALRLQPFQDLWISKYAMKEGMIEQMLQKS